MKKIFVKSKITFTHSNLLVIKDAITHWIHISNTSFAGRGVDFAQSLLSLIEEKLSGPPKDIYTCFLDAVSIRFIHDAVAEEYIDYSSISLEEVTSICENTEFILYKNYRQSDIFLCHPCKGTLY